MPVWAYLMAIPIFGVLILAHEAGHYLGARAGGIGVSEFAIGFGPRLLQFDWRGTTWSLRLLPLGGYVRWHEEGPASFSQAPRWARAVALFSGPVANVLLAMVMLTALLAALKGYGWQALVAGPQVTLVMILGWVQGLVGLLQGEGLADLSGPVGIAQATAQFVTLGLEQALLFTAFLSLNIALFNLLPIPALDGGRLLLVGLESIRRRPLDPQVEGLLHAGGFLLLMLLLVFTAVKDFFV